METSENLNWILASNWRALALIQTNNIDTILRSG